MTEKLRVISRGIWREIPGIFRDFYQAVRNQIDFYAALLCAAAGFALMLMDYLGWRDGNFPALWCWLLCLYLIFRAFSPVNNLNNLKNPGDSRDFGNARALWRDLRGGIGEKREIWIMAAAITAVYLISHLAGYNSAPWNNYGLFDDAAWDIFIAKERCFQGDVFELIYWDGEIGLISRELLFHHYIALLFRLFGYNMFVFNMGLIFLGWITVFFTALLACEIFKSPVYGFLTGFVLNFLPLEYTQVFMGHRYAICGPMMMVSLYFLYRAARDIKSKYAARRALTGGIFAGLAMESAIMGKQYLWALIACLFCLLFAYRKQPEILRRAAILILAAALGYILTAFPLYAYIFTHSGRYRARESSLIREFFKRLGAEGWPVIWEKASGFFDMVFAARSDNRQFSRFYPILTVPMAVCVFPGMIIAWLKKYYFVFFMIAIPAAGCLVSGGYDFRVLIAAPFLIFAFMFGLIWITESLGGLLIFLKDKRLKYKKYKKSQNRTINPGISVPGGTRIVIFCAACLMIFPGVMYIYHTARDSGSEYLLNHADLMASRYIQDVVTGSETPDFTMKYNEFNRPVTNHDFDVFAATRTSFAHVHAFLQPYDSRRILGLFNDRPYIRQDETEMRRSLAETLADYRPSGKSLKLVFEYDETIDGILDDLTGILGRPPASETGARDGYTVTMMDYQISPDELPAFLDGARDVFGEPEENPDQPEE